MGAISAGRRGVSFASGCVAVVERKLAASTVDEVREARGGTRDKLHDVVQKIVMMSA